MNIYTASKVHRAPMWRELRKFYKPHGLDLYSSWINEDITPMDEADKIKCELGWIKNVSEAANCKALICYAEKDDSLSGTLVEIGCALGNNRLVYLVGDCERYSTWLHHPNVLVCNILDGPVFTPESRCAAVLDYIAKHNK